jgi:hypothetical protein
MRKLPICVFVMLSVGLSAEDLKPDFKLIGDVSQKVAYTAPSWESPDKVGWLFQTDLKPTFTYGPVSFTADTTWYLPLNASLTPDKPQLTVYEAYFRVTPVESLDLTLGQKHYNIGVGQIFTVGDTINPVIGFFDQKTGFRGATAEWSPVSWASASAAYSTGSSSSSPSPGAPPQPDKLVSTGLGLGAGQISFLLDKLQLTASTVAGKNTLNPALGASYDLGGIILTGEGAAEFRPDGETGSSQRLSGSGGARYTATLNDDWDLTLAAQYLYWANAVGVAGAATDPAARGIAHTKNAFFQLQLTGGTEFSLATLVITDLEDHSVLHQTVVTWTPWDNVDFVATLQTASGSQGDAWQYVRDPLAPTNFYQYTASLATTYHF